MGLLSQIGDIAQNPSIGVARQVGQLFFPREYELLSEDKNIIIDTVIAEKHDSTISITNFAVENGADMSDHFIVNPSTFNLTGIISDVSSNEFVDFAFTGLAKKGFDAVTSLFESDDKRNTEESGTKSQLAWKQLKELQKSGKFVYYMSNLEFYQNMMITRLAVSQDKDTSLGIFFDMTLQEVLLADNEVIKGEGQYVGSEGKGNPSTPIDMAKEQVSGKLNPTDKDGSFLDSVRKAVIG